MKNIKLRGAKNTRDFGGLKNKDGLTVKPKCFLRSAALNELTSKDADILKKEYRLGTVIDLRTDTEVSEKPDMLIEGVEYIHIPVFTEETAGITHEKNADKREMLSSLPDLNELYRHIVSDENCVAQLRKVFDAILSGKGTVLWHCTEGKDRCGIVSALFLLILDVDKQTIYEDYLFTNNASSKNAKKYYRLVKYLMRDKESAQKLKKIFSAEREYLDSAFDEINKKYGSTDAFLRDHIGISDEAKAEMKKKYTE